MKWTRGDFTDKVTVYLKAKKKKKVTMDELCRYLGCNNFYGDNKSLHACLYLSKLNNDVGAG